jgi:hypothetical protein
LIYYILATIAIAIICFAVWAKFRAGWRRIHQQIPGSLILVYGILLAFLTGSYTELVLPGVGGVALGTGAGAAVGLGAWFALGTIGVATGGVGLAIGAAGMAAIGALFGGIGGASGGLGIREVSYWLIHPVIWIPLLVLGAYFIWGHRLKKSRGQKNTDL